MVLLHNNQVLVTLDITMVLQQEESGGSTGRVSSGVGGIRARFEKFEPAAQKKKPINPSSTPADTKTTDKDKIPDDAQKLVKDLQAQLAEVNKAREADRKELMEKIEGSKKHLQKERSDLRERNIQVKIDSAFVMTFKVSRNQFNNTLSSVILRMLTRSLEIYFRMYVLYSPLHTHLLIIYHNVHSVFIQLETRMKDYSDVQKGLVDTQHKLHEERETWQREKHNLLKEVDDTKRLQIEEKDKIVDLLAEVRNDSRFS